MMSEIDAVYLWVDGTDPRWQKKRAKHQGHSTPMGAVRSTRFTDSGELKHSLRTLNTYAPWIRKIHIVTAGQRPSWLVNHDKIHIVDHREIFPNHDHLPCFNSTAIESHIWRIP